MQSTNSQESSLLHHTFCKCGSSDGRAVYSDGGSYCFVCNEYQKVKGSTMQTEFTQSKPASGLLPFGEAQALGKRKLTEETCKKFGYTVGEYQGQTVQIANYRGKDGSVVAQKIRLPGKNFKFLGDAKSAGLYGQHLWRDGGKMLTITEGEICALSMSQAQGNKFPTVSISTGAAGAKRCIQNSLEFVESFEKVIIMFDNDTAGQTAALEVAQLLSPGKAHIATLSENDPSDMIVNGKTRELLEAMWSAKVYRPDGIINGEDLWDAVSKDDTTPSIPYPFPGLNTKTRGMRRGELVTITAGSGVGKSQVCREIAYHLSNEGESVGYIALEENVRHTAISLMGLAMDKPLHLSRDGVTEEEMRDAFNKTVGNSRFFLYDHFGSMQTDNLLAKVRYLAKACNVGWVILDHLSIVVSGVDDGDERKSIDVIMTKLRSLVEETGIGLILVSHLRRPAGEKGWENGMQVTLNSLRGSASIAQLSDMCLSVERDQQGENPNVATVRCLKNRHSGETGIGCYLHYNKDTGRMVEVDDPNIFEDAADDGSSDF
jgi:twinkle protein